MNRYISEMIEDRQHVMHIVYNGRLIGSRIWAVDWYQL